MKKKTFELSTNLIGAEFFYGTYHGYGRPEETLNEWSIEEDFENEPDEFVSPGYYAMNFDFPEYMDKYGEIVQEDIQEMFNELKETYGLEILEYKPAGHWSPREYNFADDRFNFDITVDWPEFQDKVISLVNKIPGFREFLKEEYSNRRGFISFTPNNYENWEQGFLQGKEVCVGAGLRFLFLDFGIDQYQFLEKCNDRLHWSQFVVYEPMDEFKDDLKNRPDLIDWEGLEDWQLKILNAHGIKKGIQALAQGMYNGCSFEDAVNLIVETYTKAEESRSYVAGAVRAIWNEIESATGEMF